MNHVRAHVIHQIALVLEPPQLAGAIEVEELVVPARGSQEKLA